ncbi:DUF6270 domain-containing protein [Paeniglutamicibacter sp. NPDC012692]|uniref:DUF6270 domain-containing protein n=1 Tax=Paeniglutamicibacter sp. NPDC012692 TaxID=3364388 RepID=UPI0036CCBAAA
MARIFVYGGCVTRDAFELMKGEHTLVQYVARQSLISANSQPTRTLRTSVLTTSFQDRAVRNDLDSTLHSMIRSRGATADMFMFDILSERLGVYRLPGKTYITRSVELAKSKLLDALPGAAVVVNFGTDTHFDLWKIAADKFITELKTANIFHKTMLFEAPWTDVTELGEPVPRFRGWSAAEANALYARYYEYLQSRGLHTRRIPADMAVSTASHKWGPSPYHYVGDAYLWMRDEAQNFLDSIA